MVELMKKNRSDHTKRQSQRKEQVTATKTVNNSWKPYISFFYWFSNWKAKMYSLVALSMSYRFYDLKKTFHMKNEQNKAFLLSDACIYQKISIWIVIFHIYVALVHCASL